MAAGVFRLLEESPEEQKRRRISFVAACVAEVLAVGLLTVICASLPKSAVGHVNRYVALTFPGWPSSEPSPSLPFRRGSFRGFSRPMLFPHPTSKRPESPSLKFGLTLACPMVPEPLLNNSPERGPGTPTSRAASRDSHGAV